MVAGYSQTNNFSHSYPQQFLLFPGSHSFSVLPKTEAKELNFSDCKHADCPTLFTDYCSALWSPVDISYFSPAVVLPPIHSSPAVRYRLHCGYMVRHVCGIFSQIHSDTHLLTEVLDFLPAKSLLWSLNSILHHSAFQISLFYQYYYSSLTYFLNKFNRIVWFSVSKYLDMSRTTTPVYPCSIYSFILLASVFYASSRSVSKAAFRK